MMITDILSGIKELKLVCPSDELIEVRMEHLEALYTYIRNIDNECSIRRNRSIKLEERVIQLKGKIDLLNSVTKSCLKKKNIDEYM